MSTTRLRATAAVAALILTVGACSSSASTASPAGSAAAPSQAPTATAAPTEAPTASPTATPTAAASESAAASALPSVELPSSDQDLEGQLPDAYGGETLQKLSFSGADATNNNSDTKALLDSIGKSVDDFSVALAFAPIGGVSFIAVRIKGADQATLQRAFELSAQQSGEDWTKISLAGRDVFKSAGSDTNAYYYLRGDTAFGVVATDDSAAGKALAELP